MGLRRRAPQNFYRYQFLDGNPEDKRQLGRDMHKWKDVIKTDFLKKKYYGRLWICFIWLRIKPNAGPCKDGNDLRVQKTVRKFLTS